MADFLDQKRREITDRMAELAPQVAEYKALQEAASALNGLASARPRTPATSAKPSARRRGPGRPRGSRDSATATATARAVAKTRSTKGHQDGVRGPESVQRRHSATSKRSLVSRSPSSPRR